MNQVKILTATNPEILETNVNEELKRLNLIEGLQIVDIKYSCSGSIFTAMIEFNQVEKKILFEQDIANTEKIVKLEEK